VAHAQLEKFAKVMYIFNAFGQLVETKDTTSGLLAPPFVGCRGRSPEIDNQIPFPSGVPGWKLIFGME
jgi:hypothetical protein